MDVERFITVDPAIQPGLFCVEVRTWNKQEDNYVVTKCSQALKKADADALAVSWAKALKLEIR